MPIVIKNYQWSQTEDLITITIALAGKHQPNSENILITDNFIKFNSPPYYFELLLANAILKDESICRILECNVKFILKKQDKGMWSDLVIDPKQRSIMELKKEIMQKHEADTAAEYKMKKNQKSELKKQMMDKEMEREEEFHKKLDNIYNDMNAAETRKYEQMKKQEQEQNKKQIDHQKKKATVIVPPIREAGHIEIDFTPRLFVTPQRESQEHAEREWCLKQNEIKKSIGFSDTDLRAEERDPRWLLEKGNDFYRKKNYLAAISAYTTGINIASNPAVLLVNRAAAHFALENYNRCAMDTSKAYELFVPAVPSNLNDRIRCITLRGRSLVKLGYVKEGYLELKVALKLCPGNDELKKEIEKIEQEQGY